MSTRTEQLIAQKEKEIEQLRATQYEADILTTINDKKHTEEQLYTVADAFCKNYERKVRQNNLVKARQAKASQTQSAPAS